MTIHELVASLEPEINAVRQQIHENPELGLKEYNTSALIEKELREKTHVDRIEHIGETGLLVEIKGTKPGTAHCIALRGDMDALPIKEDESHELRSRTDGIMHACGHDIHMACLLGTAKILKRLEDRFYGSVKLFFQPAEETFYGAQSIVDKGHLDDVMNFIAVHIALSAENKPLPSHTVACGGRDFLSDRQLDVYLEGKAAHPCGASQEGKNALLAACSAALNIHSIAPHEEGLCRVNVGEIHAGVCANTIAPDAMMRIEYRGQKPAISEYAGQRIFDILEGTAKAYDLKYHYVDYGEVPAGASDYAMMEVVQRAAQKVPWFQTVYFEGNVGGTDDAAVMLTKVQQNGGIGSYVGIGADTTGPVHNPEFDFDEDCLQAAMELCVYALEELHGMDA